MDNLCNIKNDLSRLKEILTFIDIFSEGTTTSKKQTLGKFVLSLFSMIYGKCYKIGNRVMVNIS